jgi:phosphoglucomutase
VLACKVSECVPYFAQGLKAVARSMPTSAAVDLVAQKMKVPCFEVPTGWKFFVNLCDAKELGKGEWTPLLCGEESFGTGSSHIREKDGIFAILCWLSVLAHANQSTPVGKLVSVQDIVHAHWREFGRNHYVRYDYDVEDASRAKRMTDRLTAMIQSNELAGKKLQGTDLEIAQADEFTYHDPVDESVSANQGWRFLLKDGSRFVFRLSGTGSSGATVRLYLERMTPASSPDLLEPPLQALKGVIAGALHLAQVNEMLGMSAPSVIT